MLRRYLLVALAGICVSTSVNAQTMFYEGTMKSSIALRMTLERHANILTGKYQYVKFGKDIRLEGTMLSSEHFILNEFDSDGKQTGVFRGRFAGFVEPTEGIMGEWSSPEGEHRLFELYNVVKPYDDIYTGDYKRVDQLEMDNRSVYANISLRFVTNVGLYAKGEVLWRGTLDNHYQGDIDGVCRIVEANKVIYDEGGPCRFVIQFTQDGLVITEDKGECYGANVTFNGNYQRILLPIGKNSRSDKRKK